MTQKEKVEHILAKYKSARNDDNILFQKYIEIYCREFTINRDSKEVAVPLKYFSHLPSFESISRVRRLIQSQERNLEADIDVQLDRVIKKESFRNNFSIKR